MRIEPGRARELFGGARVARLATVRPSGGPHLVPVTFAMPGAGVIVFAVDGKPKSTRNLQRLANIAAEPRVALLADGYDEDWTRLWWVRADGVAVVVEGGEDPGGEMGLVVAGGEDSGGEFGLAVAALIAKYRQYRVARPAGPVVRVTVHRWVGWRAG